jgi:hypothetical protein
MRALTLEAGRLGAAHGLYNALSEFHPELGGDDAKGHHITVELGSDARLDAVLDAIQAHITARNDGPARMQLEGHHYTFHSQ